MRKRKPAPTQPPSLGALILAVSRTTRTNREAIAAVADLLDRAHAPKQIRNPRSAIRDGL